MEAVSAFLQFVPMEDEILDFFKPVASQILNKLKARPCIPTQPNSQGKDIKLASWRECLILLYVYNKGADQPAHLRSLVSTFVIHSRRCNC